MKTARSGSGPRPRPRGRARSWRLAAEGVAFGTRVEQAEVVAVADDHPGAGAEQRPPGAGIARIGCSSPSRSSAFVIVVRLAARDDERVEPSELRGGSGPRPLRRRASAAPRRGQRSRPGWRGHRPAAGLSAGGASRAIFPSAAAKAPRCWSSSPSRGEFRDVVAPHRLAELHRGGSDPLGVVEVGGRLDDRPGAPLGVLGLEDPRADEVALGAELHRQRGIGRGRDAAGAEDRHRQPAGGATSRDDLERRPQLLRRAGELLAAARAAA